MAQAKEELGGFDDSIVDPWRDADVYDLLFVNEEVDQSVLLSAPETPGVVDDDKVVVLDEVGAGILAIDTGASDTP